MATKSVASIALLLSLNLLFFTMVSSAKCPVDALKFKVCANVLGLIQLPPNEKCCSLLGDLLAVDAALCLCTAIKANVLGIDINLPIDLSLLLNQCNKDVAKGFKCPN
ncbi:Bifunctional inhibitor/lipid-transfer protein/seed storage 2S albumin superfamily protein [Euphorbia peplus]|nr:Bifunctional inhibitor/lipid-transfer protein/seed storage 2S albumin superfamily protein [Euphorbia peplus]